MSVPNVFLRITTALDRSDIGYMLSGSFASAHYGVPRSTQDIDLVIEATPEKLAVFVESLSASEYYADLDAALGAHKRQSMFNVIDMATGWKIDMIIRKSRDFSREEFERRQRIICIRSPSSSRAPRTWSFRNWSGQSWRNRGGRLKMRLQSCECDGKCWITSI